MIITENNAIVLTRAVFRDGLLGMSDKPVMPGMPGNLQADKVTRQAWAIQIKCTHARVRTLVSSSAGGRAGWATSGKYSYLAVGVWVSAGARLPVQWWGLNGGMALW